MRIHFSIEFQLELAGYKSLLIRHIWAASFVPFSASNAYVCLLILAESFQDYSVSTKVLTDKLCIALENPIRNVLHQSLLFFG